jgi:hypothetical protein
MKDTYLTWLGPYGTPIPRLMRTLAALAHSKLLANYSHLMHPFQQHREEVTFLRGYGSKRSKQRQNAVKRRFPMAEVT